MLGNQEALANVVRPATRGPVPQAWSEGASASSKSPISDASVSVE